jgi:hypothetical protein
MVIHGTLLTAVHPQAVVALTGTDPAPPPELAVALDGFSGDAQLVVKDQMPEMAAPTPFLAATAQ